MNTVNRIVIVLLLLVVMALCSIVLLAPVPALNAISQQSAEMSDFLSSLQWYVRIPLGILFALTLVIICLLLILVEVRRPKRKFIRVRKAAGGEVLVSVASIADRLRYDVNALTDVLSTKSKVSAKRKGVVVSLEVETATGIDVPEKAEQIIQVVQQVIEEDMGLKLARPPKVNLRAVSYPRTKQAPVEPKKQPAKPQLGAPITPLELDEPPSSPFDEV